MGIGRKHRVHVTDFDYKGHQHRASEHDPQFGIKSDKTDHIAAHKSGALWAPNATRVSAGGQTDIDAELSWRCPSEGSAIRFSAGFTASKARTATTVITAISAQASLIARASASFSTNA